MKKKLLEILLATTVLFCMLVVPASAQSGISVVLNGQPLVFDVQPQMINDRTMVPMRTIFEALGAEVTWEDDTQTAIGYKCGISVQFTINDPKMVKNHCDISLDTPAMLLSGRTMLPVRAVSESFGIDVQWDDATQTVILTDKGVLGVYDEGDIYYEGELVNGAPYGYGTMWIENEDGISNYIGYFYGEFLQCGVGAMEWSDGDIYIGYIENDQRNGYGIYTFSEGERYEGYFVNDYYEGYGELYYVDGGVYKGNWVNDKKEGYGEEYWVDGDIYKGNWVNGLYNGYGEYYWSDGDWYKGEWLNNARHGSGTLYSASENCIYKVIYKNDEIIESVPF